MYCINFDDVMDRHAMDRDFVEEERSSINSFDSSPANIHVFAASSTLHGFSHMFAQHHSKLRKFTWAVAFATSLILLIFQSSNRALYYSEYPHVTRLDEVAVGNLTFPAVTICNLNEFRKSNVTRNDMYHAGQLLGFLDSSNKPIIPDFLEYLENLETRQSHERRLMEEKEWMDYISDFSDKSQLGSFNMFEFYSRTGHDLEDYLLSCTYRGVKCNGSYFKEVYTRYGKCYTFNSGEKYAALTTLKGGVDNGLELLLDTQQDEYMPVWAGETDEISIEAGFKVQIHIQAEPPFIHELGFGISPGFQTLVATQEQRITFLPDPWGDCVDRTSGGLREPFYFKNYSISACRISCETKFVVENCSCRMIHMPGNTTFCTAEQYMKCADQALDYLMQKDESICVCKTPCEVTRYNLEMSSLMLPSTRAASYLAWKYNVTEQYVKDNFVKLNIFFEALNYETIDQKKAYELPGLLGDIGGQMGLFIGASMLTVLELFDYIYEYFKDKLCRGNSRKSRQKAEKRISASSALLREPEGNNTCKIVAPTAQYHAVPGTIAMSFPQQRNSHFNESKNLTCHGPPIVTSQPRHGISQSRNIQYSTLPYKSSVNFINACRPVKYTEEPLPPPPPEYIGQSMMTLGGDCGSPEMTLTKRYNPREGRRRETSLSYNDLPHLGETSMMTNHRDEIDDDPRYHIKHDNSSHHYNDHHDPPLFRATAHGFAPVPGNDSYILNYHHDYVDDHTSRCLTPTKIDYSKTLETDIH